MTTIILPPIIFPANLSTTLLNEGKLFFFQWFLFPPLPETNIEIKTFLKELFKERPLFLFPLIHREEKLRYSFLAFTPLYCQMTIPRSPQSPLLCSTHHPGSSPPFSVILSGSNSLSSLSTFLLSIMSPECLLACYGFLDIETLEWH